MDQLKPIQGTNSTIDNEILGIIDIHSYASNIYAAYKARKEAINICKKHKNIAYPTEYVERLMQKNYPVEYEKAILGKRVKFKKRLVLCITILIIIALSISCYLFYEEYYWGRFNNGNPSEYIPDIWEYAWNYEPYGIISIVITAGCILILSVLPAELNSLCKKSRNDK